MRLTQKEEQLARQRLETALELAELAEEMVECRIRRERPEASQEEVERELRAWYAARPGAPYGDGEGDPIQWPRR